MKRTGFDTMSVYRYPFYIMMHPSDGLSEMKVNKKGSPIVAAIIVLLWLLAELLYRSTTDFDVNPFYNEDVRLFRVAVITIAMYAMVCVSNWCFCTLLEGKGRLKDIAVVIAYALLPYVLTRIGWILMSGLFTADEQIIFSYCVTLAKIWSAVIAFLGLREIHEYSVKKTIVSVFLTILGLLIILFLSLLFIMLMQQLYSFVLTLIFELTY